MSLTDVVKVNDVMVTSQDDFVTRMGFEELLHGKMAAAQRYTLDHPFRLRPM